LWNNRQRPHDVLKTYVEIYNALPAGEIKDRLWSEIETRLRVLTTAPETGRRREVPIQSELRPPLIGINKVGLVVVPIAIGAIAYGIVAGLNPPQIILVLTLAVCAPLLLVAVAEGVYAVIKK